MRGVSKRSEREVSERGGTRAPECASIGASVAHARPAHARRAGSRAHWLAFAALLSLASACGDDDGGCDDRSPLPCDIRSASCRCAVFAATREMRQQSDGKMPPARLITRAQFAEETRATVAQEMQSEGGAVYQESLTLLGLLPTMTSLDDAETDATISGVAAYYDDEEQKVTIIDDAAEEEDEGVFTLSHEYVHALQDQREGLSKLWDTEDSSDGLLSIKTLVEGEATLLSDLVMFDIFERPFTERSLLVFDDLLLDTLDAVATSPAPMTEAQLGLAYPVGALALGEAFLLGGIPGVNRFYPARPKTVTAWLEPGLLDSLPTALACIPPDPPSGYKSWGMDRLGATGLVALGSVAGFSADELRELASAWTNDLFALHSRESGSLAVVVAWRIGMSDQGLATQLEAALRKAVPTLEIKRSAGELLLLGASDKSVFSAWSERDACKKLKARDIATTRLVPGLIDRRHPWSRHALPVARFRAR